MRNTDVGLTITMLKTRMQKGTFIGKVKQTKKMVLNSVQYDLHWKEQFRILCFVYVRRYVTTVLTFRQAGIKQRRIPNLSTHQHSNDHHFGTGMLQSHSNAMTSYSRGLFQGRPLGPVLLVPAEPGRTWRDRMSGFGFRTAPGKRRTYFMMMMDTRMVCLKNRCIFNKECVMVKNMHSL